MNWTTYWARLPEDEKDQLRAVGSRYIGFIGGIDDDGAILTNEAMVGVVELQRVETEVLDDHRDWLALTKATFEACGIEWTIGNLNHYSRLWEHE